MEHVCTVRLCGFCIGRHRWVLHSDWRRSQRGPSFLPRRVGPRFFRSSLPQVIVWRDGRSGADRGWRGRPLLDAQPARGTRAFNQELWYALTECLDRAASDDGVRCVLLTGSGRAFSAGQDLAEMADPSVFEGAEPGYERLMPTLEAFPKPLIAAVNGVGVGIGLTALLHCDMALISADARLKVPFMSLGVTTEAAASVLLPSVVGAQRAAEIIYTEPWIDAETAVADGLALRSVPAAELMDRARELAALVASKPLPSLVATKKLITAARIDAVRAARRRESAEFASLVSAMTNGSDGAGEV
ncbi:MAG: enoyl-CoA hydratase/isomerase family protein [Microthrixaceae bacterium]